MNSRETYLRTFRKKSGLSQQEVALLLGYADKGQVSRHERGVRTPTLFAALGYETIYRVPVSVIFASTHATAVHLLEKRIAELKKHLGRRSGKGPGARVTAHKIEWLTTRTDL